MRTLYYMLAATGMIVVAAGMAKAETINASQVAGLSAPISVIAAQ